MKTPKKAVQPETRTGPKVRERPKVTERRQNIEDLKKLISLSAMKLDGPHIEKSTADLSDEDIEELLAKQAHINSWLDAE